MASVSDPRVLDDGSESGVMEFYHFDPDTNGFVIEQRQDVTGLIETNKRLYNDSDGKFGEWNLVARFPMTVLWDLMQRGILDRGFRCINEKAFGKWLNDPENRVWRTKGGRV